jgi:hypothetical protein
MDNFGSVRFWYQPSIELQNSQKPLSERDIIAIIWCLRKCKHSIINLPRISTYAPTLSQLFSKQNNTKKLFTRIQSDSLIKVGGTDVELNREPVVNQYPHPQTMDRYGKNASSGVYEDIHALPNLHGQYQGVSSA